MRGPKAIMLATVLVLGALGPAAGHENHDALGAGPGKPAPKSQTPAAMPGDHAGMAGMHGPVGPTDAAMGRDVAADDMAMSHGEEAAAARTKTFGERLASWLGRLHTVVIHFPIAMIIGAFAVELFGAWRHQPAYRGAAAVMLVVGALGAVAAAGLGWFAGGFYWTDRNPVLMTHRWLGTTIAVLAAVLAYQAASRRHDAARSRTAYWALLGTLAVAIAVQGYLGGSFMHGGLDHLAF